MLAVLEVVDRDEEQPDQQRQMDQRPNNKLEYESQYPERDKKRAYDVKQFAHGESPCSEFSVGHP
jgi:hypothetical protein